MTADTDTAEARRRRATRVLKIAGVVAGIVLYCAGLARWASRG